MTKRSINLTPFRVKREALGVLVNGQTLGREEALKMVFDQCLKVQKISCCENTIVICLTNFKFIVIKNLDLFLLINKYSWLKYEFKINKEYNK